MGSFYYNSAVVLAIALAAFGVFYIAVAGYGFVQGGGFKSLAYSKLVVLSRFLSGLANIMIGITLYWHVNETTASTTLVLLTMSVFVLWEWFARTYFIDRTDHREEER
jgi:hypothetical protein